VSVRVATTADTAVLEELWQAFEREVPPSGHVDRDPARERAEIDEIVGTGLAFVAEEDGRALGFALARRTGSRLGRLTDLYVVREARRAGHAAALVHAVADALAADGVEHLDLEVDSANAEARSVYQHWGFREDTIVLVAPLDALRERLAPGRHAESFASIHVQTDALADVRRATDAFAPRIGSRGSRLVGPRNGWVAVYDEVCDADPNALLRYARELSSRMGAVVVALSLEVDQVVRMIALDRGGIVDEYLSVPEFYGALPPGDVIGLAANPTVLARLTGAEPARVREAAPTARSAAELPPARELLARLAATLGLEGAEHGYAGVDDDGPG
jgi:ribosomal protein S18 acetylase RimI-like enzyme